MRDQADAERSQRFNLKTLVVLLILLLAPGVLMAVPTARASATAAADERWDRGFAPNGIGAGAVYALALDPASPSAVYAGGLFYSVGGVPISGIAKWDGGSWSPLGQGLTFPGTIYSIAVDKRNGNVFVGGDFSSIGGVTVRNVAMWDVASSQWLDVGGGTDGVVRALALDGKGTLYVGGEFTHVGGAATPAAGVAMWKNVTWSALGQGLGGCFFGSGIAEALAADTSGTLYVGGCFTTAGPVSASCVARWKNGTWSALGAGADGTVYSMALDQNGKVYVGGLFDHAGGLTSNSIAVWNGSSWTPFGSGMRTSNGGVGTVRAIVAGAFGSIFAAGDFSTAGGVATNQFARWDGSQWSDVGGMAGGICALAARADGRPGNIFVGGTFTQVGTTRAYQVASWNGSTWSALGGNGLDGNISAMVGDGSGGVVVGGSFSSAGSTIASNVAKWNGKGWTAFSTGVDGSVLSLGRDAAGNIYAGGNFAHAGGTNTNRVARWDGSSWSSLKDTGTGTDGTNGAVSALAVDGSGNLYAGGAFTSAGGRAIAHVAKWNGSTWAALGSGLNGNVNALVVDAAGTLYAGGDFTATADNSVQLKYVAKWNGTSWIALGPAANPGMNGSLYALALDGVGNLVAGGGFTLAGGVTAKGVAKWLGGAWSALGSELNGTVYGLAVAPGTGHLYAAGSFYVGAGVTSPSVANWDGAHWTGVGSGLSINPATAALADQAPEGERLFVGGLFDKAGGRPSCHVALWHASGTLSAPGQAASGDQVRLLGASPNPFRSTTNVRFDLSASGPVQVDLYDVRGRQVKRLLTGSTTAGSHRVVWDGTADSGARLAPGIYFCRVSTRIGCSTEPIILVR